MNIFIFGLVTILASNSGALQIDRYFCSLFKDQSVYQELDLGGDGCSMNLISPTSGMLCIVDPNDNDVPLEYTCRKTNDLYER